ncbi:MAG: hypothetical protein EAZ99_13835 [Alphaproteobacteria bacterium]|nr:tripartite tricarboxylate transporter TctB family protein [Alphaproteobacteria bacterium]TAD88379.1 MAG: hypothetical protein EAZ99_13835 [Alphaproteobacteria bacterium]
MRSLHQWQGDAAVGGLLAAVGALVIHLAQALPVGTWREPGPGAQPLVLGVALVVLGLLAALRAWRVRDATAATIGEPRAVATLGLLGGFVLLLEPVGFLLTAPAFLIALIAALGGGWRRAALIGLPLGLGAWAVFDRVLGVPLPPGLLPL